MGAHLQDFQEDLDSGVQTTAGTRGKSRQPRADVRQDRYNQGEHSQMAIKNKSTRRQQKRQREAQVGRVKESDYLEITFEEEEQRDGSDSGSLERSSEDDDENMENGCFYCQPHIYGNEAYPTNSQEDHDPNGESLDSLQQEYIDNLRRKCKAELKRTKNKHEKMLLDNDLRMSYRHNIHDFKSNLVNKKANNNAAQNSRNEMNA